MRKPIGTIHIGKFFMTTYVGEGSYTKNKKKYEFEMLAGAVTFTPMVKYGTKTFELSWDDILKLALKAGLFEDGGENAR